MFNNVPIYYFVSFIKLKGALALLALWFPDPCVHAIIVDINELMTCLTNVVQSELGSPGTNSMCAILKFGFKHYSGDNYGKWDQRPQTFTEENTEENISCPKQLPKNVHYDKINGINLSYPSIAPS